MTKIVKSPKKQSAKITKLKMRVGEIANMLLQNNPKMVRMRSGGSSGYADLFMSKQLMKGGMNDGTQTAIVDFLKKDETDQAVKALKTQLISKIPADLDKRENLISELNNDNVYDYKLCDKYDDDMVEELQEDLITLDIVNKFYNLVKDKKGTDGKLLLPKYPSVKSEMKNTAAVKIQALVRGWKDRKNVKILKDAAKLMSEGKILDTPLIINIKNELEEVIKNILSEIEALKEKDPEQKDPAAQQLVSSLEAQIQIAEDVKTDIEQVALPAKLPAEAGADGDGDGVVKPAVEGGKPPAKYKSTGRIVHIMYKKRKYKRTVYTKDKRNTKYCKIDGEYILLSKMKMIA